MFELRYAKDGKQLQIRVQNPMVDASGAICGFGWGNWQAVPVVPDAEVIPTDIESVLDKLRISNSGDHDDQ